MILAKKNDHPKELVSCIAQLGPLAISDDSMQSEVEGKIGLKVILFHEEAFPHNSSNLGFEDDWFEELSNPAPHCYVEKRKNPELRGRINANSCRRKRREHSFLSIDRDAYAHIMFHNRLSTLVEESQTIESMTSSGYEADIDPLWSSWSRPMNLSMSRSGSFDERFIQARWEYSLQVMSSGSFVNNGALIDARDEINDMLIPTNPVSDNCSVDLETGEI